MSSTLDRATPHPVLACADAIEEALRGIGHLEVTRIGHSLVARTDLGREIISRMADAGVIRPPARRETRAVVAVGQARRRSRLH